MIMTKIDEVKRLKPEDLADNMVKVEIKRRTFLRLLKRIRKNKIKEAITTLKSDPIPFR